MKNVKNMKPNELSQSGLHQTDDERCMTVMMTMTVMDDDDDDAEDEDTDDGCQSCLMVSDRFRNVASIPLDSS